MDPTLSSPPSLAPAEDVGEHRLEQVGATESLVGARERREPLVLDRRQVPAVLEQRPASVLETLTLLGPFQRAHLGAPNSSSAPWTSRWTWKRSNPTCACGALLVATSTEAAAIEWQGSSRGAAIEMTARRPARPPYRSIATSAWLVSGRAGGRPTAPAA